MVKRTLFFTTPHYLATENEQLRIVSKSTGELTIAPIEDIGCLVLDSPQATISHVAMQKLIESNVAVIYCNDKHLPVAMMMPLVGHQLQNERFRSQVNASEPLKKQLWQQTIRHKIANQRRLLENYDLPSAPLRRFEGSVKSGDTTNREAQASRVYWSHLFTDYTESFTRERFGASPNNFLNYGYAVLRAIVARALCGSGLLCTLGIHHHNRYNAFCLADDMMEPYRPFVDDLVLDWINEHGLSEELSKEAKMHLLRISLVDTLTDRGTSPLEVAVNDTAKSLVRCFAGETRKLKFAQLP